MVENSGKIVLKGDLQAADDLSGVVVVGDYIVVGSDEGHALQVLSRGDDRDTWQFAYSKRIAAQEKEVDLEAITYEDGYVYAIGSHALRRRTLKPDALTVRDNERRFQRVQMQPSRNNLYRVEFDPENGAIGKIDRIDLSKRLRKDPMLGPFTAIPSKENGIDIEGIAVRGELLYLGFRGPVFRYNMVPVLCLKFDKPKAYSLRFVQLDGQGIRDMAPLDDGFLILSGPVGDAHGPFQLWWWDGEDQLPGKDREVRPAVLLGPVSASGGARAEGIAVLRQKKGRVDLMVIYDNVMGGAAIRLKVGLDGLSR